MREHMQDFLCLRVMDVTTVVHSKGPLMFERIDIEVVSVRRDSRDGFFWKFYVAVKKPRGSTIGQNKNLCTTVVRKTTVTLQKFLIWFS